MHALIRGVLGSDQYIGIDGRFGYSRQLETVREEVERRNRVLPIRETYVVDVFHGPRIGQNLVRTINCEGKSE